MDPVTLKATIAAHGLWLRGIADGKKADLSGANLYRANLSGRKPLLADIERNYVLYVLPEVEDGPRFIAGCRNFTRDEAIEHWGEVRPQPSYVAAINAYVANAE